MLPFHLSRGLRAIRLALANRYHRSRCIHSSPSGQYISLIDVIEPRLLYSADHPLGMVVGISDSDEQFEHLRDAQTVTNLLDSMVSTVPATGSDSDQISQVNRTEATSEMTGNTGLTNPSIQIDLESSLAAFNDSASMDIPANDGSNKIIYVNTLVDRIDATNTTSFELFNNGSGGDNQVSLREAISVANADPSVHSIQLMAGIFALDLGTGNLDEDANEEGDLDLIGTYTIKGSGEGETKVRQSVDEQRVFEIHTGTITIEDLTLENGAVKSGGIVVNENNSVVVNNVTFNNNDSSGNGGALYVEGSASLFNVTIKESNALNGAAIAVEETGTVIVHDSVINNNVSSGNGGAVNAKGRIEIYDSLVDSNRALSDTADARGGAIWIDTTGVAIINDTVLKSNGSNSEGGAIFNKGELTLKDSELIRNVTERRGAGLYNGADASLEHVTIWKNIVTHPSDTNAGAGIFNNIGTDLTVNASDIIGNTSNSLAGGLGLLGTAHINDSIIVGNTSTSANGGGGILVGGSTTLTNSIVADNLASGSKNDVQAYVYEVNVGIPISVTPSINSNGFNFIESATNFNQKPTDIIGLDPGITVLGLDVNSHVAFRVDPTSATINSGRSAIAGTETIDGSIVGETPNIGGYISEVQSGIVFWSNDNGAIYRSDASFTYSQKIIDGIGSPLDIEVDTVNHRVYWLDSVSHSIFSAKYDGTDIVSERQVNESAVAIALDPEHDRFFVATEDVSPQILQYFNSDANFQDTDERAGELIRTIDGIPSDIELDDDSDIVYWTEVNVGVAEIMSVETRPRGEDPQSPVPIVVAAGISLVQEPYALAIKDLNDQVFWSEPGLDLVAREDASGSSTLSINDARALAYDTLNDRLLVSNGNSTVFGASTEFDSMPFTAPVPETIHHMTYAFIDSDERFFNSEPLITSGNSSSVPEEQTVAITITSSDAEFDTLEYSIVGGADANLFEIDSISGDLTFVTAPDYENPGDQGIDNIYNVDVQVNDGKGGTATQAISVSVTNVDETPVILAAAAIDVVENQTGVLTANSNNVDGGSPIYSKNGGADSDLFSIDSASGVLIAAAAIDAAENQTGVLNVSSSNVDGGAPVYSKIGGADSDLFTIDSVSGVLSFLVAPDFEAPVDADSDNVYEVTVQVADVEGDTATQAISVSVTIDSASGVLTFLAAPDFEAPADANSDIQVADVEGDTATQAISVSVTNENEIPVIIAAAAIDAAENQKEVLTVSSSNVDGGAPVYSKIGGADRDLFAIDSASGVLTFQTAPDFEAPADANSDNVYELTVQVADVENDIDVQSITVNVMDEDDIPVINADSTSIVPENQTAVLNVTSLNVDGGRPVYTLNNGPDSSLFNIDRTTGALMFQTAPDFEAPTDDDRDNTYQVSVQVADRDGDTATQAVIVNVTDVNEIPIIGTESTVNIFENQTNVLTVGSYNVDGGAPVYSIVGGVDQALFSLDSSSGRLTLDAEPDFEAPADSDENNIYEVTVQVADSDNETVSQELDVIVSDFDEIPDIIAADTVDVDENQIDILTVASLNVDGSVPHYSISGGADAMLFNIDSSTGQLTFLAVPNYENATDGDTDNLYEVIVQVADADNDIVTHAVQVTVNNVNDDPVMLSESIVNAEEHKTVVYNIVGFDEDNDSLVYSISGGLDAEQFTIDSSSGELTFRLPPDFESPSDIDANNVYEVKIEIIDNAGGVASRLMTINVTDQNDAPIVNDLIREIVLDANSIINVGGETFFDQDGDELVYNMSLLNGQPLPYWLAFDSSTSELRLDVPPSQFENEQILVIVSDSRGGVAEMTFNVRYIPTANSTEPTLLAAMPSLQASTAIEFETLNNSNSVSLDSKQSIAGNSLSGDGIKTKIYTEIVASVSAETVSNLVTSEFPGSIESDNVNANLKEVLLDNVLSAYFAGQANKQNISPGTSGTMDIFNGSLNIANLFALTQFEDAERFSIMSDSFDKHRDELDAQIIGARGAVGSAAVATSGLSIGYLLYLLRGGAIMSSMLASLPAWRFVDPLPILGNLDGSQEKDEESLQSIVVAPDSSDKVIK